MFRLFACDSSILIILGFDDDRLKRNASTDADALERLRNADKLVITPCKNLPGQRSISYDDRFILGVAERFDGAIISNDNFADLLETSAG